MTTATTVTTATWRRAVTLRFTGSRGGQGPATWGQRAIWRLIHRLGEADPFYNIPWTLPIAGRAGLGTVLDALRTLVERHEALRTTCEQTPAGLVQRVARTGELTVGVFDASGARPLTEAKRIAADLAAKTFDYGVDLPVRCAVVLEGDRPRAIAFGLSHLAVDGWALDLIAGECRALIFGDDLPEPSWQPLDQAAFEQGPRGAARGERSLRHWESLLRQGPLNLFDLPRVIPEEPRFVRLGMESAAAARAARTLAERWSISTASVLTAASVTLLATVTGHSDLNMQLVVSNRHIPRIGRMVGTAVQDGLVFFRLGGTTFGEVARRTHRQALLGCRNAYYDPVAWDALRRRVGRERGGALDISAYFNDTRPTGDWPDLPEGGPAVPAAPARTFVVGAWRRVDATVVFSTGPATHTGQFYLVTDTACVPRATAEAMLRGLETLLIRAVIQDVPLEEVAALCGLGPLRRRPAAPLAAGKETR
ncbi:hypothetical protein HNP84_006496 [Thermocatellispora tengchongensis]|uniref:Condensation domain-containing protein n=1 Tax=Thermocatellispora tengchongensis TaxID=1073253 RepID=A0A840PL20_9ACTN|nr:condensation domain-containing protein [Thermocatellispora tengchongensis]MBB5136745.1 hypothetical protein [Thermocatellispora tengchongensis]